MEKPTVSLIGVNGNAFFILGKVIKALKKAGYDKEFIEKYKSEATNGDYDHLLRVTMKYVNVE